MGHPHFRLRRRGKKAFNLPVDFVHDVLRLALTADAQMPLGTLGVARSLLGRRVRRRHGRDLVLLALPVRDPLAARHDALRVDLVAAGPRVRGRAAVKVLYGEHGLVVKLFVVED